VNPTDRIVYTGGCDDTGDAVPTHRFSEIESQRGGSAERKRKQTDKYFFHFIIL
jgi:hypothetical protein